jgi:hypothetical protein
MAAYDFTGLVPSDFEALSHDLLESSLGVPLQAFVTGRDKGIDLRYAPVGGQDWIVQCKHFARSGFSKLRSHLAKKELSKIKTLRPSRYILATSVGLSPSNVDELFELLAPYIKSKHDIFGQDNLNALLRTNPAIEQRHFKLWLTSEAVLLRVLHNDVFVQSVFTEEQIKQKLGLYVHTDSFEKARQKLESERVCILSGIPGVGKTTLAEMLLVEHLMNDWQVVAIHQNVTEGQRLFSRNRGCKQVFYYDDFLGQISTGEKLGKNEDRTLLQLIDAVARTANKRFILTTREYILAQARAEHETLARANIDLYRFVVSCDDYSDLDKARILANHLYFANVPQGHIAALVEDHTYRKIISHRNYNPRIIEWMTKATEVEACRPKNYPSVFLDRLDNPSGLWLHAFENQISEAARHLLLVLGSCGDGLRLDDLRQAFEAFYLSRGKRYRFSASPSDFKKALQAMEGNFIRIDGSSSEIVVSCHNPSILDFLHERLCNQSDDATDLLRYAILFEQVERLFWIFHIGATSHGNKEKRKFDAEIIKQAIDRTLSARSVRLNRIGARTARWLREPANSWQRLETCCYIGNSIPDPQLRRAIQDHVDGYLSCMDHHPGELSGIMSLLDLIDDCKWLDVPTVDRWHQRMWAILSALESNFDEPLEGLSAVAQWYVDHHHRFDRREGERFRENLACAVSDETYNSDRNDPERLGGDLAIVQKIAKTLGREFSNEINRLSEALDECDSTNADDGGEEPRRYSETYASSIESLFESLLE